MSPIQHLGVTWQSLFERVERSGRWPVWVAAEPFLGQVSGLEEVVAITQDMDCPGRADVLLAALVRLAAVDGGNDQDAAHAVALLLANGASHLSRRLRILSKDVDQIVAGPIWLPIREFPWPAPTRAIPKYTPLAARRAVPRDGGVAARRGGCDVHRWGSAPWAKRRPGAGATVGRSGGRCGHRRVDVRTRR